MPAISSTQLASAFPATALLGLPSLAAGRSCGQRRQQMRLDSRKLQGPAALGRLLVAKASVPPV
jgi:hypothetical protein